MMIDVYSKNDLPGLLVPRLFRILLGNEKFWWLPKMLPIRRSIEVISDDKEGGSRD